MNSCTTDTNALFRLDGQVAIVTGAGAGIGRCIAELFIASGARVIAVDLNPDGLSSLAEDAHAAGGVVETVLADISKEADSARAIAAAKATFGRLDILVNNAGIYPRAPRLPELDMDTVRKTYDINIFGTLSCTAAAANDMPSGGRIINISSMESLRPSGPGNAHYSSTKAALNAMTRAWAVDLAPRNIRVNAILPGLVQTEGTSATPQQFLEHIAAKAPSGRVGVPQDIAGVALFLASAASDYINGQCLVVDGGITITG